MIIATVPIRRFHTIRSLSMLVVLLLVIHGQIGFTKGDSMKREDFQVLIDAQRVTFTTPPVLKMGHGSCL